MPRFRSVSSFLAVGAALLPAQVKITQAPPPPAAAAVPIEPQPLLRLDQPPAARSGAAEVAIRLGLEWLLKHQDQDGRWNSDEFMAHDGNKPTDGAGKSGYDVALTGLALWTLAREGPATGQEPRRLALLRGASWLAKQQDEANGRLGTATIHDFVYGHAMGTLGLLATAAATGDANSGEVAQRAIGYLERHRNPYGVWRYQPRDNDNDSSVTTWALCAYLAAHELRLEVNAAAFPMVSAWFQQVTDADGRTGYAHAGEGSSRLADTVERFPPTAGEAMTAAALLCRTHLGHTVANAPILAKSVALVLAKPPQWDPEHGAVDLCYWFFASEGLRTADPAAHAAWTAALVPALTTHQRQDTTFAGSWDPIDPWGENGGRVYATALAVLALQATAQHPPAKK